MGLSQNDVAVKKQTASTITPAVSSTTANTVITAADVIEQGDQECNESEMESDIVVDDTLHREAVMGVADEIAVVSDTVDESELESEDDDMVVMNEEAVGQVMDMDTSNESETTVESDTVEEPDIEVKEDDMVVEDKTLEKVEDPVMDTAVEMTVASDTDGVESDIESEDADMVAMDKALQEAAEPAAGETTMVSDTVAESEMKHEAKNAAGIVAGDTLEKAEEPVMDTAVEMTVASDTDGVESDIESEDADMVAMDKVLQEAAEPAAGESEMEHEAKDAAGMVADDTLEKAEEPVMAMADEMTEVSSTVETLAPTLQEDSTTSQPTTLQVLEDVLSTLYIFPRSSAIISSLNDLTLVPVRSAWATAHLTFISDESSDDEDQSEVLPSTEMTEYDMPHATAEPGCVKSSPEPRLTRQIPTSPLATGVAVQGGGATCQTSDEGTICCSSSSAVVSDESSPSAMDYESLAVAMPVMAASSLEPCLPRQMSNSEVGSEDEMKDTSVGHHTPEEGTFSYLFTSPSSAASTREHVTPSLTLPQAPKTQLDEEEYVVSLCINSYYNVNVLYGLRL